jgi:hypothetical protein
MEEAIRGWKEKEKSVMKGDGIEQRQGYLVFSRETYSEETVPFLEIDWRRRILWNYPNNRGLHLRRRSKVILSDL